MYGQTSLLQLLSTGECADATAGHILGVDYREYSLLHLPGGRFPVSRRLRYGSFLPVSTGCVTPETSTGTEV